MSQAHQGAPRVGVVVAAKNASATIARAVASALAEPEVAEVVVVDDGSSDDTAAQAWSQDDGAGRLSLIRFAENHGPAAARNAALDRIGAEFVCVLDADDLLRPGRMGALLAQIGDYDAVADDLLLAHEDQIDTPFDRLIGARMALPCDLDLEGFVEANLTTGAARRELGFLKPLFRMAFLREHALRYDSRLRLGEDFVLYARALALGARIRLVEACGYVSVQRPGSLSHTHTAHDLDMLATGSEAVLDLPGLSPRARALLRRHVAQVRLKLDHRRLLAAKQDRDFRGVLAILTRTPATAPYVARCILRDKHEAWSEVRRASLSPPPAGLAPAVAS
jgi:succinoglycan biosynthesis protein ExoU